MFFRGFRGRGRSEMAPGVRTDLGGPDFTRFGGIWTHFGPNSPPDLPCGARWARGPLARGPVGPVGRGPWPRGPWPMGPWDPRDPGTLGPWDPGILGPWDPGTQGPWEPGTLGTWDPGTLGPWEPWESRYMV